jgi:hypothetical protein
MISTLSSWKVSRAARFSEQKIQRSFWFRRGFEPLKSTCTDGGQGGSGPNEKTWSTLLRPFAGHPRGSRQSAAEILSLNEFSEAPLKICTAVNRLRRNPDADPFISLATHGRTPPHWIRNAWCRAPPVSMSKHRMRPSGPFIVPHRAGSFYPLRSSPCISAHPTSRHGWPPLSSCFGGGAPRVLPPNGSSRPGHRTPFMWGSLATTTRTHLH